MSTRKLILTALALGMAILIAGSVQLLRLSGSDTSAAKVFKVGQTATVGDLEVTVVDIGPDGRFDVVMALPDGGSILAEPAVLWSLQAGDLRLAPLAASTECGEMEVLPKGPQKSCTLGFAPASGTRYLRFVQDEAIVTWVIED